MFAFLQENIGTIIVSLGLLAIVALIVRSMIKRKKSGQGISCGCGGCSGCPGASLCHKDS